MPPSAPDSTSQELVSRLKSLSGEFSPSVEERYWNIAVCGLMAVACLCALVESFDANVHAATFTRWWVRIFGVGMATLSVWAIATRKRHYFFKNGTVGEMTDKGTVVWEEDLSTLIEVRRRSHRGGHVSLSLYWPNRQRTLDVYRSLADQLNKAG